MDKAVKDRMSRGLGCKPEEVPDDEAERGNMWAKRIKDAKEKKLKKVQHG